MNPLRQHVVGVEETLPLLNGEEIPYINFDNAASTPSLVSVLEKVNQFVRFYSSIHRGTGFKSRISSHNYEVARQRAGAFVGFDPAHHTVIFGKNATEGINKLSYRLSIPEGAVILVSQMEHHSNDLPWRDKARVIHIPVSADDGTLRMDELKKLIETHKANLFLVAVTGASNVTGILNPLGRIAELVHDAGAHFMVDAAQLVPHRKIRMGRPGDPGAIDFLTFSAHKMYAPFGTGVLVARKDLLAVGPGPEYRGGGTVRIVTLEDVSWDDVPFIDEPGSPNVVGAIALAEAIAFYEETGYEAVEVVERKLTEILLDTLSKMPNVEVYGKKDPKDLDDRLGVVPFNMRGLPHALLAAILAYEYGIGVRNGCFCAHPYIKFLLHIEGEAEKRLIQDVVAGDRSAIPGAVRISFGFYNEEQELDRLLFALREIGKNIEKVSARYVMDKRSGQFFPSHYHDRFEDYFKL